VQQFLFVNRNSKRSGLTEATTLTGVPLKRFTDTGTYLQALGIFRESTRREVALADNSVFRGLSAYRVLLREKRYLDYSSILEEAVNALETNAGLRKRIASRLKAVIVDEYQDLNPIQERLVRALHDLGAALTVVGDDDQTLYQWRGSDLNNILGFTKRYPKVKTITLQKNFRSSKGITDVARLAIAKNTERLSKIMISADSQTYEIGDIMARQFDSPQQEADHIAATCKALRGTFIRDGGGQRAISWSDMAVLVRVSRSGEMIRKALQASSIPAVSIGMSSLFDAPEAEAARQLFYLLAGRADTTPAAVSRAWMDADLGLHLPALKKAVSEAKLTAAKMTAENEEVCFSVYNLQRQFTGFLERIGLLEESVLRGRGEIAFYNLGKFSQAISDFETINFHSKPVDKYKNFAGFLEHQAENVYSEAVGENGSEFATPDAIQILTIHRAKGLQWPVVFVPQLVANRFPIRAPGGRTAWHLIPSESIEGQQRYRGSLEDERRLFYVAVTRSQKHLHLSTAPTPGNQQLQRASGFYHDVLESQYVKRHELGTVKRKRGQPTPRAFISDMTLSFSDVKHFISCPYQFKLRILYGFNAPLDEALGYGKSLHDVLAELHDRAIAGESITEQMAQALVARHMHVPYAYPKLRQTLTDAALRTVRDYIRQRAAEFSNLEMSEQVIEVRLDGGVSLRGRIDLVTRRDSGVVSIVDFKSTNQSQTEHLTDAQLHIYALGYRELTGRNADLVEVYNLDRQEGHPRSVDDGFIQEVMAHVRNTAASMRSNDFKPRPSDKVCRSCDYGRMCSARYVATAASQTPRRASPR